MEEIETPSADERVSTSKDSRVSTASCESACLTASMFTVTRPSSSKDVMLRSMRSIPRRIDARLVRYNSLSNGADGSAKVAVKAMLF